MYHQAKPDTYKRVLSEEEELSLGPEWGRSRPPQPEPVPEVDPLAELRARVEVLEKKLAKK